MDYHPLKACVNQYFLPYAGGHERPVFWDIASTNPALDHVTNAFVRIRKEFDRVLLRRDRWPRYHEIDPGESKISASVDPDKSWNVFMLYVLGFKPKTNRTLCPETCQVLDRIPTLLQAFFSVLDPGKNVPRHEGPYLGYLRYHLGLRVPKEDPPVLVVNGIPYVWKEGQAVLFDDSWPHEVMNSSREIRGVLIVDVLRPMPWLPSLVNKAVIHGLARPAYGFGLSRRAEKYSYKRAS